MFKVEKYGINELLMYKMAQRSRHSHRNSASTRYFEKGEKVLCYEPDPTKAKVLYDSKVRKHLQLLQYVDRCTEVLLLIVLYFSQFCVQSLYVLNNIRINL